MICVSCLISAEEWQRIDRMARLAFPGGVLSRSEVMRRFSLAGMEAMKDISQEDRARAAHGFKLSMQVSDERLRH